MRLRAFTIAWWRFIRLLMGMDVSPEHCSHNSVLTCLAALTSRCLIAARTTIWLFRSRAGEFGLLRELIDRAVKSVRGEDLGIDALYEAQCDDAAVKG